MQAQLGPADLPTGHSIADCKYRTAGTSPPYPLLKDRGSFSRDTGKVLYSL